jgi:hypothetical protein
VWQQPPFDKINLDFIFVYAIVQLVFQSDPGEREVTALSLGGPKDDRDQIFAAFGQVIRGYKKKATTILLSMASFILGTYLFCPRAQRV